MFVSRVRSLIFVLVVFQLSVGHCVRCVVCCRCRSLFLFSLYCFSCTRTRAEGLWALWHAVCVVVALFCLSRSLFDLFVCAVVFLCLCVICFVFDMLSSLVYSLDFVLVAFNGRSITVLFVFSFV